MTLATVALIGSWVSAAGTPATGTISVAPVNTVAGQGVIVTGAPVQLALITGTISATVIANTGVNPTLQLQIVEQLAGAPIASYVITPAPGRVDTVTNNAGNATITDTAIGTADHGKAVAGTGVPVPAYVGTVTAGTSFVLVDGTGTPVPTTGAVSSITVGAVDLSTAARGSSATPIPLYVLSTTLGQPSGVATLGTDGVLATAQRPPAGAGTVTSVTAADTSIVIGGTPNTAPTVRVGSITESQVTGLTADLASRIAVSTVTAKGDLLAGAGASTISRLGAGADGQVLAAASGQVTGLQWVTPGAKAHASTGTQTSVFPGSGGAGTAGTWTLCPAAYQVTVTATAGDVLEWSPSIIAAINADAELDVCSVVAGTPVNYYSGAYTNVQGAHGHGGLYLGTNYSRGLRPVVWLVQSGDVSAGTVTLALLYRAAGTGVVFGSTTYPSQIDLVNLGP